MHIKHILKVIILVTQSLLLLRAYSNVSFGLPLYWEGSLSTSISGRSITSALSEPLDCILTVLTTPTDCSVTSCLASHPKDTVEHARQSLPIASDNTSYGENGALEMFVGDPRWT